MSMVTPQFQGSDVGIGEQQAQAQSAGVYGSLMQRAQQLNQSQQQLELQKQQVAGQLALSSAQTDETNARVTQIGIDNTVAQQKAKVDIQAIQAQGQLLSQQQQDRMAANQRLLGVPDQINAINSAQDYQTFVRGMDAFSQSTADLLQNPETASRMQAYDAQLAGTFTQRYQTNSLAVRHEGARLGAAMMGATDMQSLANLTKDPWFAMATSTDPQLNGGTGQALMDTFKNQRDYIQKTETASAAANVELQKAKMEVFKGSYINLPGSADIPGTPAAPGAGGAAATPAGTTYRGLPTWQGVGNSPKDAEDMKNIQGGAMIALQSLDPLIQMAQQSPVGSKLPYTETRARAQQYAKNLMTSVPGALFTNPTASLSPREMGFVEQLAADPSKITELPSDAIAKLEVLRDHILAVDDINGRMRGFIKGKFAPEQGSVVGNPYGAGALQPGQPVTR